MQSQKRARVEEAGLEGDDEETVRVSKSRACTECKKHKIKCDRAPGSTECARCTRLGHKCFVVNQLQKIIEVDSDWKKLAAAQISQLQSAVTNLLHLSMLPQLSTYHHDPKSPLAVGNIPDTGSGSVPPTQSPHERPTAMTRANSREPDSASELVSAPMSSLYEVTKLRNLRSRLDGHSLPVANVLEEDFISRGIVSLAEAEKLFTLFHQTLNQFLWGGIALVHSDLTSVRRSSSILSTAILCVAALHIPGDIDLFNKCYTEFISLVSNSTLNRYHTLDEIRGLAIGAFWLSDLSWKLSGHAVRIATEMNLHQSSSKMSRGQQGHAEGARLWYLLYVCDHHFSIAYGRPPVIHDSASITNHAAFLQSSSAEPGDVRLCIQVALFIILTKVYHTFGSDELQPLTEDDFPQLRAYNVEIESWRLTSQPMSANNSYIGTYPSRGVVLYYHFAKFFIHSLALRAFSSSTIMSMDRREAANVAIASAMAILNTILYEPDIRNAIVGIPLFTHTMVAFSSVFLMKVAWKWKPASLNIDQAQIQDLIHKVVDLLSSAKASEKHLAYHIATGLKKMLMSIKQQDTLHPYESPNRFAEQTLGIPSYDTIVDTFDVQRFELDHTWDFFSNSVDFLPMPPMNGLG